MSKVRIIVAAGLLFLLSACAGNNIKSFERVVVDVEANAGSYSEADWERADEAYKEFMEKYDYEYLTSLSDEEQQEVGRLVARYAKVRLEYANRQMRNLLRAGSNMTQGYLEEMGGDSTLHEMLSPLAGSPEEMDEIYEELENLFEEYGNLYND